MQAIKLHEAIRIIRPDYVYLRLKPSNSIRNNNTHKLARTIATLYRNVYESIRKDDAKVTKFFGRTVLIPTKVSYHTPSKVAYFVYIEKRKVEFYFVIPRQYSSVIREKMSDVWPHVTIEDVESLPEFDAESTRYQLVYTKEDALSLASDRRDNELLTSTLNVIDVMEDGDRCGVFYNFVPTSQFTWRAQYRNTIERVKRNMPTDRDKTGLSYVLKTALAIVSNIVDTLSDVVSDGKRKGTQDNVSLLEATLERLNGGRRISPSTERKSSATVLNTQIVVMSRSDDALRQRNNARSLAQAFDTISDDNALRPKSYNGKLRYTDYVIRGAAVNKCGDGECQSFIALPGRDVLERYNVIERIETQETQVPEDLRSGVMCVGTNTYRGMAQKAYLSDDREYRNLTLLLIGPTRAGKSTLIANLARDAVASGECVVIFDFIGQCELSSEVASVFTPDKVLNIDCRDFKTLQGMGYNEVGRSEDPFEAYDNAKKQTTQLMTLINSINAEETRLSAKMQRYLTSAALVTFISNGSIRNVFDCLQDHEVRAKLIAAVPKGQRANLAKYTRWLGELDERDKEGNVVGTKDGLIAGIIDRLNQLEQNAYMEKMLDKDTRGNVNLVDEMQRPQLVCIRMPSDMFSTDAERDVYTTYWSTKVWLALQMRSKKFNGDRAKFTKVNLVVDELYQVEHTEVFMKSKLSQYAKFGLKPIISAHYINQIGHIRTELRSANASYMLISGCDKKNYDELKDELYPYTVEDLLSLPRYHALNLLKCKDGYARFISKLPPPLV